MKRNLTVMLLCAVCGIAGNLRLFGDCWVQQGRPLNSKEPRVTSVPEIPGGKTLTLTILDADGQPLPHAKFSYFGDPKPHSDKGHRLYAEADGNGQFVIRFKPDIVQRMFEIQVDHPGFAPYNAQWENIKMDPGS
ncbi:MAG: hypothetical protein LBQ54_03380 [Planctomycetaceae bacterium]|nr:hypothetical protein [Planctomycetaceae bacterium]